MEWSKYALIGVAFAAGAIGHYGVRRLESLCRAGIGFVADCLYGWMDGLDDLAPGRLVHGQGDRTATER